MQGMILIIKEDPMARRPSRLSFIIRRLRRIRPRFSRRRGNLNTLKSIASEFPNIPHHIPLYIYIPRFGKKGITLDFQRLLNNARWLIVPVHLISLAAYFSFIPIIWFALSSYIPKQLQRLRFVALFYFFALLFVANLFEQRVFGEIIAILYVPIIIGLKNWHLGEIQIDHTQFPKTVLQFLDRFGGSVFLVGLSVAVPILCLL